jgi:hypothetical protein
MRGGETADGGVFGAALCCDFECRRSCSVCAAVRPEVYAGDSQPRRQQSMVAVGLPLVVFGVFVEFGARSIDWSGGDMTRAAAWLLTMIPLLRVGALRCPIAWSHRSLCVVGDMLDFGLFTRTQLRIRHDGNGAGRFQYESTVDLRRTASSALEERMEFDGRC